MEAARTQIAVAMLLAWVFPVHAEIVKYTDILLSPEKYLNREVTMQGAFSYKNTERKSFDMKQGDNTIEVFYERLPKTTQAGILGEKNFSETPVAVKGVLKRFGNAKNSYYIIATAVSLR